MITNFTIFLTEKKFLTEKIHYDYDHLGENPKFDQAIQSLENIIQQMDQNSNPDDIVDQIDEFRRDSLNHNYSPSISSSDRARYILVAKLEEKMKELGIKYVKRHNYTDEEEEKFSRDTKEEGEKLGFF